MPRAFRVVTWIPKARARTPGHPAYVARKRQGAGRIDNPDLYGVLYLSSDPAGAVAEHFGRLPVWRDAMFLVPGRRTARRALATFEIDDAALLDLDDPPTLMERALRPSTVVARDRAVTQAWAREAFLEDRWRGIGWWSPYDSRWACFGLWDAEVRLSGRTAPLHREHAAVREAAETMSRTWATEPE